ncbi:MAG: alpha/beta fold hydrolase [Patescibacteria group bacterium]
MRKEFFIKNKNGQKIAAVLYNRSGYLEKRETLIFCHGFTGDKEEMFYPVFFPRLAKEGFQVLSFDMNGHGKSYGCFKDFTLSKAISDLTDVYNYLTRRGIKRMAIAGHSIGGAVCLLAANSLLLQAVILLSPVSQPNFFNEYFLKSKTDRDFLANFGFYPNLDYNERGKAYLIGRNFFFNFEKLLFNEEGRRIKKPFLLIHAGQDKAVPLEDSRKLYNNLDFDVKKIKVIKGSDHNFKKRRYYEPVINSTLKWLKLYLKKGIDEVVNVQLRRKDGRILIVKRSPDVGFFPSFWGTVGGFLHRGETIRDRAKQELREEVDLKPKDLKLIRTMRPYFRDDKLNDRLWHVHGVLYETKKMKIKTDWETSGHKWIKPEELGKYRFVPNQVEAFKKLNFI